tara:strand:+ start:142 stop:813 length:672 start_codon:yes stop_codon:yes gene_type:complete
VALLGPFVAIWREHLPGSAVSVGQVPTPRAIVSAIDPRHKESKIMKFKTAFAAAAALTLATAANAQVGPEVGATVYGPEGNTVGTIEAMQDGVVVVNTGTYTAPVPANAFGEGPEGPIVSVTKDQLNAMMAEQEKQMAAARDAALIENATVLTADGVEIGTVTSIDGDNAIVTLEDGPVSLMRDQFATNETGALIVLATKDQLMAALNGGSVEGGEAMEADAE